MDSAALIAELVERLARLVRAEEHGAGLNPAQWEALRYLSACNRFSNTAGALTQYLGITKGTVSQTLNALERKGLIRRVRDPLMRRIVRLELTAAGGQRLADDPLQALRQAALQLPEAARERTAGALAAMLAALQRQRGRRSFGVCHTCRHFERDAGGAGVHRCGLIGEPLTGADSVGLCVEHADAA